MSQVSGVSQVFLTDLWLDLSTRCDGKIEYIPFNYHSRNLQRGTNMLCRPRILTCFVGVLLVFGFMCHYRAHAVAGNAISVKAKTATGSSREIPLYSGYHALVIGCSNYTQGWPSLPNAARDAQSIGQMLKDMGWEVNLVIDPDTSTIEDSLYQLITGPGKKQDRGILIWYSGHGYTFKEADGSKLGYIVPTNAPDPGKNEYGFMKAAISMRDIETVVKRILSKHVLVVFDSCFSGAIFRMVRAAPSTYINEKVASPVRQFITAGNENEQVPDKSVFKEVFIKGIQDGYGDRNKDGYITGEELGAYLAEEVVNYSRGAQHPQYGKINNPALDRGDFVFVKREISELNKLKREIARLTMENTRLKNELSGGIARLDAENTRLKNELAGQNKLESEIDRLQKELTEQKEIVAALRSEQSTSTNILGDKPKPNLIKSQPGSKLTAVILPWRLMGDADQEEALIKNIFTQCMSSSKNISLKYSYYDRKDTKLFKSIGEKHFFDGKEPSINRIAEFTSNIGIDIAIIGRIHATSYRDYSVGNVANFKMVFLVDVQNRQISVDKDMMKGPFTEVVPQFICGAIRKYEQGELEAINY